MSILSVEMHLLLSESRLSSHPRCNHHARAAGPADGPAHTQDELQHVRLHVRVLAADGHRGDRDAGTVAARRTVSPHDLHDGHHDLHHHDPHQHLRRRHAMQLRGSDREEGIVLEGAFRSEVRPRLQGLHRFVGADLRRDPVPGGALPDMGVVAVAVPARGILRVARQRLDLHRVDRRHRHGSDVRTEADAHTVSAVDRPRRFRHSLSAGETRRVHKSPEDAAHTLLHGDGRRAASRGRNHIGDQVKTAEACVV